MSLWTMTYSPNSLGIRKRIGSRVSHREEVIVPHWTSVKKHRTQERDNTTFLLWTWIAYFGILITAVVITKRYQSAEEVSVSR